MSPVAEVLTELGDFWVFSWELLKYTKTQVFV